MSKKQGEEDTQIGIAQPNETDVLCGRGGAALRHPGNQTYRRLVNLNKGLYITCLKTEKLKISRSIVAAIREQNGRFLEKKACKVLWFDIGDKKAIEKTSQALREGQPKLRQKIVEMGGGAAGTAALIEQQFGANGIYTSPDMSMAAAVANSQRNGNNMNGFENILGQSGVPMMPPQHQIIASQAAAAGSARNLSQHNNLDMPPPPPQSNGNLGGNNMFSSQLRNNNASEVEMEALQRQLQLRSSLAKRTQLDLGIQSSQQNFMSDMAAFNNNNNTGNHLIDNALGLSASKKNIGVNSTNQFWAGMNQTNNQMQVNSSSHSMPSAAQAKANFFDRRRMFAASKYHRQASARFKSQHSLGDGMPDIHMVESSMSVYSNLTSASGTTDQPSKLPEEFTANKSNILSASKSNFFSESRLSMMSGLSRISDNSEVQSIFSDLSRKIGNVSTRSIAMSEISGIEEQDREDDASNFGTISSSVEPRSKSAVGAVGGNEGASMEFDVF